MASNAGRFPATPRFVLDRSLTTLSGRAAAWLVTPIDRKVEYLRSVGREVMRVSGDLVGEALAAKGVDERYSGEDWVAGPVTLLRTVRFLAETLEGIADTGRVPISEREVSVRPGGQVVVRVVPSDRWDRVLYRGVTADVWLDPEVGRGDLEANLGSFYTKGVLPDPRVVAVLGAGNVASIGPLDVIHKLFVDGAVVVLKYNPVNDYVGPHIEAAFADLIADGFVRTAYGGADVGEYLVRHPSVGEVHITGAARTHDSIVWGPGEEGEARRAAGTPLLDKPITSELGNVSPVIVVPGRWKERDLRFQAEGLATQMMQNNGFNCNAAKVILFHRAWPQRHEFLAHLRRVLLSLPSRPAYYPGAEERFDRFVESHSSVEMLGRRRPGVVPPALLVGVDPEFEHLAFTEEAFCSLAATTELGGDDTADFLARAVEFCNDHLEGTLNVTLLVDSVTERALAPGLDAACAALRYGTVGINIWAAAGFVFGTTPWGGYPGATIADVQSGIGFVHNARLIDRPHKTVVRGPFRPRPKPPWFVTHGNTHAALRRSAEFEADPGVARLVALSAAAVRS
jgi:aldehyde dehydrogenase (NAD(P)+)